MEGITSTLNNTLEIPNDGVLVFLGYTVRFSWMLYWAQRSTINIVEYEKKMFSDLAIERKYRQQHSFEMPLLKVELGVREVDNTAYVERSR